MSRTEKSVRFDILGPLRVRVDGSAKRLTAARERAMLAMLVLHADQSVPVTTLIEALWDDEPPINARNQVQVCISRLRRLLSGAGDVITTEPASYRIAVRGDEVDLIEFRRLRQEARTSVTQGNRPEAATSYRSALALWRGPALAGIEHRSVRLAAAALEEERVQAWEECLDVELALGAGGELVAELTDSVRRYPYQEKLHAALMLALYRAGRQADALTAYQNARRILLDELGTEPGPELQRLHRAVLNHDPDLDPIEPAAPPPQASPTAPRELPAQTVAFTGRRTALAALDEMLAGDAVQAPVVISAIAGTAGIGKTALALHWAHHVADRFPDGQLYVNLRGYAAAGSPMRPVDALATLLRSLGTPPEQIPPDEAQAAGLFRSKVADRQALVLLDNARSVDQVRPLLPGSPGCLTLVTSRDRLAGLVARDGARRLTLDVLVPDEAHELLARLLGAGRTDAEPEATAELAKACAYVPLALRIAAADVADRHHATIGEYVAELATGDRLSMLETGDDQESAVRAAFELSYRSIPGPAQRLFRLLGLVPGPDVTAGAAAALLDADPAEAGRLLDVLAGAHLIEEHATGRYAFHDLLRHFASHLVATQDGEDHGAGLERLLGWYLGTVNAAADQLYPEMVRLPAADPDTAALPPFDGTARALAWLDAERANLIAAISYAAEHGPRPLAWQLADLLRGYFWRGGYAPEWHAAATAALTAAEHDGVPTAQAAALLSLGDLNMNMARYAGAIEHYTAAVDLAERHAWSAGHLAALGNLSTVYRHLGQSERAAEYCARALIINRRMGRLAGQASNLCNLGRAVADLGRLRDAATYHIEAMALFRQLGSIRGEATAASNLGLMNMELGQFDEAQDHLTRAVMLHREVGFRLAEAYELAGLAQVHLEIGRVTEAVRGAEAALKMIKEISDMRYESAVLNILGAVYLRIGDAHQADACFRHALKLARHVGVHLPEIEALIGLATSQSGLAMHENAHSLASEAMRLASDAGYRMHQGQAQTALAEITFNHGTCHQGVFDQARRYAHDALEIHRETGHCPGQARTHVVLGQIEHNAGNIESAQDHRDAARDLFARMGAALPDTLAA